MDKKYEFVRQFGSVSSDMMHAVEWARHHPSFPANLLDYYIAVRTKDDRKKQGIPQVIISSLERITPMDFLCEYDAYLHPKNDTALENGYVHSCFWGLTGSQDQVLLVNPHPLFLRKCSKYLEQVITTYTDDALVDILRLAKGSEKYHPRKICELKESHNITRALCFVRNMAAEKVLEVLNWLHTVVKKGQQNINYLVLPNAILDLEHHKNRVRECIFSNFAIQKIVLFASDVANITPRKRCMLVLQNDAGKQSESIVAEKMKLTSIGRKKILELDSRCEIDFSLLRNGDASLSAIYSHFLKPSPAAKIRNRPQRYQFSLEIDIWVSSYDIQTDGRCRGRYSFHYPPTDTQLANNIESQGRQCGKPVTSKFLESTDAVLTYTEEIMLRNDKLSSVVREEISGQFAGIELSAKTVWYLYLEDLKRMAGYCHDLCKKVFCVPDSATTAICAIKMGVTSKTDIVDIVDSYSKDAKMSSSEKEALWIQLELICGVAVSNGHASTNPFREINEDVEEAKRAKQKMRDALVLSSHDTKTNNEVINRVLDINASNSLKLGFLLMFFTAISSGEVCALTWGDYRKVNGIPLMQLLVSKKLDQTGTQALPLSTKWKYRAIPMIAFLKEALNAHKASSIELRQRTVYSGYDIDQCPILHSEEDPGKPLSVRKLNQFCRTILSGVTLPEHNATVNSGREESTVHIHRKMANMLQSNFDFCAKHFATMNLDEIAYIKGNKPCTTYSRHYCDYLCSRGQLVLATKLENWAATYFSKKLVGVQQNSVDVENGKRFTTQKSSVLTEICLNVETSLVDGDYLSLMIDSNFGSDIYIDKVIGG